MRVRLQGGGAITLLLLAALAFPPQQDRLIYAHVLSISGNFILAYEEATAAERLKPGSPYTHAQRLTICYRTGLTEWAIHEALRSREMRGADLSACIILGHATELQGHDGQALEAYMRAKKLQARFHTQS